MLDVLDRFWTRLTDRGVFALGVTIGSFATISVFIAILNKPDWLHNLLSREERIAEWITVIFTISAFFILLATLKTTRKVGSAQVTAYIGLNVASVYIKREFDNITVSVEAKIENTGNSPAYNVRVGYDITQTMQGDVMEVNHDIDKLGKVGTPHPIVPQKSEIHKVTLSRKMKNVPNSKIRFLYMIEFMNVFEEVKTSPIISGVITEHPNGRKVIFVPDKVSTEKPMPS